MLRFLKLFATCSAIATVAVPGAVAGAKAKPGSTSGGTTTPAVKIMSPVSYSGTLVYKAVTLDAYVTTGTAALGACSVAWGDGTSAVYDGQATSATAYSCGGVHNFYWTGSFTISVTGVDASGVIGTSTVVIFVF